MEKPSELLKTTVPQINMNKPKPKMLARKSDNLQKSRSPFYFDDRNRIPAASNFDPYASMVQLEWSSNHTNAESYVSAKSLYSYSE